MLGLRSVACAGLTLHFVFAATAPDAGAAGFDFTAQSRSVSVTITQKTLVCMPPPTGCSVTSTSSQSDSETSSDFSPFSATAVVPSFTQSFATQSSSLAASSIAASGNLEAASSGGFIAPPNLFATTESSLSNSFSTSFDVDAATPFRLSGSVTSTGGLSANTTTRATLKTSGGLLIAEVVAATDPYCQEPSCSQVGPFPVSSFGVLAPGSYVLEAVATGSASPFYFAGNFYGLGSSGSYTVALGAIAVPSLSRGGLACLAAALVLVSLPTLWRLGRAR